MGKDKRPWRKLVKKLRRKRIRTQMARLREGQEDEEGDESSFDDMNRLQIEEENYLHKLNEERWLERERQAQLAFEMKKAEEIRRQKLKEEEDSRIRKEWEELKEKEELKRKELEKIAEERKEKQEQEFNEFLDFLSGDIETPPLPYLMPQEDPAATDVCPFFMRTAACRFASHCTRAHPRPNLSRIILIPNFFSHFSIEQTLRDEYDTDLNLEYEDSDLYKEFLEFYNDVMPEFKGLGDVIQFKVCCNFEPHLRGNVYIQYKDIRQAVEAYRRFNGRFYNGKQLSLQFVIIDSWRSAICGFFSRKRCPKLKSCNFLHVFRNPTKEFVSADNDWKEITATTITKAYTSSTSSPSSISSRNRRDLRESIPKLHKTDDRKYDNNDDRGRERSRNRSTKIEMGDDNNKRNEKHYQKRKYSSVESSRNDSVRRRRSISKERSGHSSKKHTSGKERQKVQEEKRNDTPKKKKKKDKKREHKSKKKHDDDDDERERKHNSSSKKHKRTKSKS